MKKFSKVLVVLCLVSVIFGAVAFSTSANSIEKREQLNITKDSNNYYNDFSDKTDSYAYFKSNRNDGDYIKPVVYSGNRTDGTYRIYKDPNQSATHPAGNATPQLYLADYDNKVGKNTNGSVEGYDYVVLDFDFASSRYTYIDDTGMYVTKTEVPEDYLGTEDVALPNGMRIAIGYVGETDLEKDPTKYPQMKASSLFDVYLLKAPDADDGTTGKWYIANSSTLEKSTVKYELSNKVNVFDHLTFILDVKAEKMYFFFNGLYLSELNYSAKNYKLFMLTSIHFIIPGAEKDMDKYSFAMDNAACNWYKEYKGTDRGLGAFISDPEVYKNESYRNWCDGSDTLYNGDYVSPGAPVFAKVIHPNQEEDSVVDCYTKKTTLSSIKDDDFIELHQNLLDFEPALGADGKVIREVTFIAEEGAQVTLSDKAKELYMIQQTRNRYTVRLATDSAMALRWFDKLEAKDTDTIKELKLLPWTPVKEPETIYGRIFKEENSSTIIQIFNSWVWDKNLNGLIDEGDGDFADIVGYETDEDGTPLLDSNGNPIPIVFSVADLAELREQGIYAVHMIPKFDEMTLAYTIETADSEGGEKPDLYVPDANYRKFTDISTLASALEAIGEGVEVKVTLYTDIELASDRSLSIPAGVTVDFDLNGYDITQSASDNSMIFNLGEGSELNITSSVKGSVISQTGTGVEGVAIVSSVDNLDACSVNFSEILGENEAVGDYLTVIGASVVYFGGSANDVHNNKTINVTIDGGKYVGNIASNGALLPISDVEIAYNISNATLITVNGESIFSEIAGNAVSSEISVISSTLLAGSLDSNVFTVGSLINKWSLNSRVYFKDSVVAGLDAKSNLALGSGNIVGYSGNLNNAFIIENGVNVAYSNNNALKHTVKFTLPDVTGECSAEFEVSAITFDEDVDAAYKVKEITWLDENGEEYEITYWVEGSTITITPSLDEFEKTSYNNGWFEAEYSGWANTKTGAKDNFVVSATDENNVFKPIAENFTPAVTGALLSLSVSGQTLNYNLYLPTPDATVNGHDVAFLGFYSENGTKLSHTANETAMGKAGYNKYVGVIAEDKFTADAVVVKFTVDGQTLEFSITVDLFDYVNKVHTEYECNSDEPNLIYSIMKAKSENGANYTNAIKIRINSYFAAHTGCGCTKVENINNTQTPAILAFGSGKEDE